jgi:hypothetical protein
MSIANTNKLTAMIKDAPDTASAIGNSISSLTSQVSELTDQKNAIQNGVCGTAKTDMIQYITNNVLPLYPGGYLVYGSGFGTIGYGTGNISAWSIYKNITPPLPAPPIPVPTQVYTYTPGDYPEIDTWVNDYSFGNDYITKPLTAGSTYGLSPNISLLNSGKAILQSNQNKIQDSIDVFSRYAT